MSERATFNEQYTKHLEEEKWLAEWDKEYNDAYSRALPRIQAWLESANDIQDKALADNYDMEKWDEGNYAETLLDSDGHLSVMQVMFLGIADKVWEYLEAQTWFGYDRHDEAAGTAWDLAVYEAIQAVKANQEQTA